MIPALKLACAVCEAGAMVERYRHIVFDTAQLRAFNGIVTLQAPSVFAKDEKFAMNEERLARALDACDGKQMGINNTNEFLVFKHGRLTVRVRKLDADPVYSPALVAPPKAQREPAEKLLDALRKVAPFVSADASRPWSVSALVRDGYVWATNNLSLVRSPCRTFKQDMRIPSAALAVLALLPSLDWVNISDDCVVVGSGNMLLSFPHNAGDWPDVRPRFSTMPKNLPPLDPELVNAAKTVEKFADRFVTLSSTSVQSKKQTIESEYEVIVTKGAGTYSARLLSLVLTHATHGDFSTYPNPIYFSSDKLEGCAVGVKPEAATP